MRRVIAAAIFAIFACGVVLADDRLRVDRPTKYTVVDDGIKCSITQPLSVVIKTQEDWEEFWPVYNKDYWESFIRDLGFHILPPEATEPPPVDFSKDMVIGRFAGIINSDQYISYIAVVTYRDPPSYDVTVAEVRVDWEEKEPVASSPYCIVTVPRIDGPVRFQIVK